MIDRTAQINELHAEYVKLTGYTIGLMGREWTWYEWIKRGLTVADLRRLVAEKRRRIRNGDLTVASLAFRNLVHNVDYAEEDIAELRARARGADRPQPGRDAVLRATGREAQTPNSKLQTPSTSAIVKKLTDDPEAIARGLAQLREFQSRKS